MTDDNETKTSAADSEGPEAGVDEKAEATEAESAGEAEGPTEGKGKRKGAGKDKTKKKKASPTAQLEDDSPDGMTLKQAQIAFEIGDYKVARELAQKLLTSSRAPIADAARDILRRTDVDPAQMIFLAACACAIIGVAFYYLR